MPANTDDFGEVTLPYASFDDRETTMRGFETDENPTTVFERDARTFEFEGEVRTFEHDVRTFEGEVRTLEREVRGLEREVRTTDEMPTVRKRLPVHPFTVARPRTIRDLV